MAKELSKTGFWQQVYLTTLKEELRIGNSCAVAEKLAYSVANTAMQNFGHEVAPEGCLSNIVEDDFYSEFE